jgi:hypothetical protein
VLPGPQSPEQHWALVVQAFPEVVQVEGGTPPPSGSVPIGAHLPLTHVSVQHEFPATGHDAPSERHCAAEQ